MRKRLLVGAGLLALVLAGAYLVLSPRLAPTPPPAIPGPAQVKRITAELFRSDFVNQPPVPPFDVPAQYVPAVLRMFTSAERDDLPLEHTEEIGALRVECEDGRVLELRLLFYGKEPVRFTADGIGCLRGGPYRNVGTGRFEKYLPETLMVAALLKAIHRRAEARAEEYIKLLDQSAGRAAPEPE